MSISPIELFKPLQVDDPGLRSMALSSLLETLYRLEKELVFLQVLPVIRRVSTECPFEEVRDTLKLYLDHVQNDLGISCVYNAPVSQFIDPNSTVSRTDISDPSRRALFEWSWRNYGRVSNLTTLLAYHPRYLECFLESYYTLQYAEGPLPFVWRAYISIMAASRHNCQYYVRRQQDAFLSLNGDPEWLRGIDNPAVPPKLRALAELNALLAHRPWMIQPEHIAILTQGNYPDSDSIHSDSSPWSVNELVHAICILCHFHATCSIILSCGVNLEADNGVLLNLQLCKPTFLPGCTYPFAPSNCSSSVLGDPNSFTGVHSGEYSKLSSFDSTTLKAVSVASAETPSKSVKDSDRDEALRERLLLLAREGGSEDRLFDDFSAIGIDEDLSKIFHDPLHSHGSNVASSSGADTNVNEAGSLVQGQRRSSHMRRSRSHDQSNEISYPSPFVGQNRHADSSHIPHDTSLPHDSSYLDEKRDRPRSNRLHTHGSDAAGGWNLSALEESDSEYSSDEMEDDDTISDRSELEFELAGLGGTVLEDTLENIDDDSFSLASGYTANAVSQEPVSQSAANASTVMNGSGPLYSPEVVSLLSPSHSHPHSVNSSIGSALIDHVGLNAERDASILGSAAVNSQLGYQSGVNSTSDENSVGVRKGGIALAASTAQYRGKGTIRFICEPERVLALQAAFASGAQSSPQSERALNHLRSTLTSKQLRHALRLHQQHQQASVGSQSRNDSSSFTQVGSNSQGATSISEASSSSGHQVPPNATGGVPFLADAGAAAAAVATATMKGVSVNSVLNARLRAHSLVPAPSNSCQSGVEASGVKRRDAAAAIIGAAESGTLRLGKGTLGAEEDHNQHKIDTDIQDIPTTGANAAAAAGITSSLGLSSELKIETLKYRDFDTTEGMLITHDFNWEEHGYALIMRFYPAGAPVLDKQFRLTFNLTYERLGNNNDKANTEVFRTALWYYIQRLFGVRNDHYEYAMVNRFVTISIKTFAKNVACAPERINESIFHSFTNLFTPSEKVHVTMLAAEARKQASLLYGLAAVMKHMTSEI